MRLLDLFCGAGGAAMGYHRVGFEVVGVDIKPQKHYPFPFILGDALDVLRRMILGEKFLASDGRWYGIEDFDTIHASPPCQANTQLAKLHRSHGPDYDKRHVDIIPQVRELLRYIGAPYVIENVSGAELENPILLCGTMFDLKVYRHRLFEFSFLALMPGHIPHHDNCPAVGRGTSNKGFISVTGTGGFGIPDGFKYACRAMGIDWMTRAELSQAIPPAYTEFIGRQLIQAIENTKESQ